MTDPGDAHRVAGSSGSFSGSRLSFSPGRGLPGRSAGLPPAPPTPGRLTSLRSRDLTLGGLKKPKKTFEPNVKAVRKSKDELREVIHVVPKKDRREREERNRENRGGRRRERPQTIQSHSIFEQGPADTVRKTAWRGSTDPGDSTASPVAKYVKKERRREEDEDEMLSKLQRDDFIDDPGLRNDTKLRPIQLPLYESSSFLKTDASATPTCKDDPPRVSADPAVFRAPATAPPWRGAPSGAELPRPEQPSVGELFRRLSLSGREELLLIQLPDCMPGRPATPRAEPGTGPAPEKAAKREAARREAKAEDRRTAHLKTQEPAAKESCPVLADFSEGMLGKLQIRKSGRVQLRLGDITMDVSGGTAFSFLQQLVSVRVSEGLAGDMAVLGNVHHKLVCSPDFQALLQDTPTQQSSAHR